MTASRSLRTWLSLPKKREKKKSARSRDCVTCMLGRDDAQHYRIPPKVRSALWVKCKIAKSAMRMSLAVGLLLLIIFRLQLVHNYCGKLGRNVSFLLMNLAAYGGDPTGNLLCVNFNQDCR